MRRSCRFVKFCCKDSLHSVTELSVLYAAIARQWFSCGFLRIKIILSFEKSLYFGRKLFSKLLMLRVLSKFHEKCPYSLQTTLNQSNRFNKLYWINVNGTISRFFQTTSVAVSMRIYDKSLLSRAACHRKLFAERLMKTNCISNHRHGDSLRRHAPSDTTDKETHDTVRV